MTLIRPAPRVLRSVRSTEGNDEESKRTLRLDIKLRLVLMIPALVGLDVLRPPLVGLVKVDYLRFRRSWTDPGG